MKNLMINPMLFILGTFFFLPASKPDGKTQIADRKAEVSDARATLFHGSATIIKAKRLDDCRAYLEQINSEQKQEGAGNVINSEDIEEYEKCVGEVEGGINKNDTRDFIFMLECYTKLIDYYNENGNQDSVDTYEDKIYELTGTD